MGPRLSIYQGAYTPIYNGALKNFVSSKWVRYQSSFGWKISPCGVKCQNWTHL